MSDFTHGGWSVFIAVATVVSLLACLLLLFFASRRRPMAGDNSTGHVFDEDLVEMNNPLPLWWAILFVITVAVRLCLRVRLPGARQLARQVSAGAARASTPPTKRAPRRRSPRSTRSTPPRRPRRSPRQARDGERRSACSSTTAPPATARMRAAARASPTSPTATGCTAARPRRSKRRSRIGRIGVMPPLAAAVGSATGRARTSPATCCSLSGSSSDSLAAYSGKPKFAHLRRLPRRRRQGQPGDRRAQPDRRHLAARLRRGRDRRHDHAGQDQRDAGAARPPHAGPDPRRRELRLGPLARRADRRSLAAMPLASDRR